VTREETQTDDKRVYKRDSLAQDNNCFLHYTYSTLRRIQTSAADPAYQLLPLRARQTSLRNDAPSDIFALFLFSCIALSVSMTSV